MKTCFKCHALLPLSEFYRHPQMADGFLNKCKECAKRDTTEARNRKPDYYRNYDQMRYQRDEHRRDANKARAKTESARAAARLSRMRWVSLNPEKRAAHIILGNAVKNGKIVKPSKCVKCGRTPESRFLHGHHEDYTKPLDVEWICIWCHAAEHFPNNPFREDRS